MVRVVFNIVYLIMSNPKSAIFIEYFYISVITHIAIDVKTLLINKWKEKFVQIKYIYALETFLFLLARTKIIFW